MVTDFSKYTIKPDCKHYETEHFWGQIGIRKEHETKELCIDILVGRKGKDEYIDTIAGRKMKNHGHMIIRKDQSLLFVDPRGSIVSVIRIVDSKLSGRLSEGTQFFRTEDGKALLTVKMKIDEPTKTIEVNLEEAKITENKC